MGLKSTGCCCCGVVAGFVLALLLAAGITFVFYYRTDPELPSRGFEQVELTWKQVKSGGDSLLEKARERQFGTAPAAPAAGRTD